GPPPDVYLVIRAQDEIGVLRRRRRRRLDPRRGGRPRTAAQQHEGNDGDRGRLRPDQPRAAIPGIMRPEGLVRAEKPDERLFHGGAPRRANRLARILQTWAFTAASTSATSMRRTSAAVSRWMRSACASRAASTRERIERALPQDSPLRRASIHGFILASASSG